MLGTAASAGTIGDNKVDNKVIEHRHVKTREKNLLDTANLHADPSAPEGLEVMS